MRLRVEIGLARLAGRLSRLAGRGGGTTLPGRVLCRLDRDAVDVLAGRLPHGSVLVERDRTARRRRAPWSAEIVGPRLPPRAQPRGREPHVRRRLGARRGRGRRARRLRGRRGHLPGGRAPHAPARGPPLQPLPRPARPLRRGRDRRGALAQHDRATLGTSTTAMLNADDPSVADLRESARGRSSSTASTIRRPPSPAPARRRLALVRRSAAASTPTTPSSTATSAHWRCPGCDEDAAAPST